MASAEELMYPPWLLRLMRLSQQAQAVNNAYNPLMQAGNNIASQYDANTQAMYPAPQAQVPGLGYAQAQAAQYGDAPTAASTLGIGSQRIPLASLLRMRRGGS